MLPTLKLQTSDRPLFCIGDRLIFNIEIKAYPFVKSKNISLVIKKDCNDKKTLQPD